MISLELGFFVSVDGVAQTALHVVPGAVPAPCAFVRVGVWVNGQTPDGRLSLFFYSSSIFS
jgi:hypothetical protein